MTIGGKEISFPNGRYQIRRYQGKLQVYTELGTELTDALARFRAEDAKLNAVVAAVAVGVKIVTEDTRKTLKQYASAFSEMHRNLPHRSTDSITPR